MPTNIPPPPRPEGSNLALWVMLIIGIIGVIGFVLVATYPDQAVNFVR